MSIVKDEKSYETLMAELQECVGRLEAGSLGVEEALSLFEKGVGLSKEARQRLEGLEGRLERLLADGQVESLKVEETQ